MGFSGCQSALCWVRNVWDESEKVFEQNNLLGDGPTFQILKYVCESLQHRKIEVLSYGIQFSCKGVKYPAGTKTFRER